MYEAQGKQRRFDVVIFYSSIFCPPGDASITSHERVLPPGGACCIRLHSKHDRRSPNVGAILAHRPRRWPNIVLTLGERLVLTVLSPYF